MDRAVKFSSIRAATTKTRLGVRPSVRRNGVGTLLARVISHGGMGRTGLGRKEEEAVASNRESR